MDTVKEKELSLTEELAAVSLDASVKDGLSPDQTPPCDRTPHDSMGPGFDLVQVKDPKPTKVPAVPCAGCFKAIPRMAAWCCDVCRAARFCSPDCAAMYAHTHQRYCFVTQTLAKKFPDHTKKTLGLVDLWGMLGPKMFLLIWKLAPPAVRFNFKNYSIAWPDTLTQDVRVQMELLTLLQEIECDPGTTELTMRDRESLKQFFWVGYPLRIIRLEDSVFETQLAASRRNLDYVGDSLWTTARKTSGSNIGLLGVIYLEYVVIKPGPQLTIMGVHHLGSEDLEAAVYMPKTAGRLQDALSWKIYAAPPRKEAKETIPETVQENGDKEN